MTTLNETIFSDFGREFILIPLVSDVSKIMVITAKKSEKIVFFKKYPQLIIKLFHLREIWLKV